MKPGGCPPLKGQETCVKLKFYVFVVYCLLPWLSNNFIKIMSTANVEIRRHDVSISYIKINISASFAVVYHAISGVY